MPASPKLYFRGLLGADRPDHDNWMVTDMAIVATLLDDKKTRSKIFTPLPFTSYKYCSPDGTFKYGDSTADRLAVPAPNIEHVITGSAAALKARFLQNVEHTTEKMGPNDRILIFLAAHGDDQGNILIGDVPLHKSELIKAIKVTSPANSVFLWSTACFSGLWLDAPWQGYAAASNTEESDSLTASASSCFRGGVNTLTTVAAISNDQNVNFPPCPYCLTHPENPPPHHYTQPNTIAAPIGLSLPNLASQANEIQLDLAWNYSADAVASDTQLVLLIPELTHDMLDRFRLLPCVTQPNHTYTDTPPMNQKGSADFRQQFNDISFWPASVDKDELIKLSSPFLDCRLVPTASHLVYLRETMDFPQDSEEIEHLLEIFRHRQRCQTCVANFLRYGPWNSSYVPTWNVFISPAGIRKSVEEFIIKNKGSAEALEEMIEWQGWEGPPMVWVDIRIQLVLAWVKAGQPPFSYKELEAIGSRAEDLQKKRILLRCPGRLPNFCKPL